MTDLALAPNAELDALATRIADAHEQVEHHGRSAITAAILAGELLTEAKAAVRHGEWMPWLAEHFPASANTASNYMRLAANSQRVVNLGSVREALAELAEPRETATAEPEPEFVENEADAYTPVTPDQPDSVQRTIIADARERYGEHAARERAEAMHVTYPEPEVLDAEIVPVETPEEPNEPAVDHVARALRNKQSADTRFQYVIQAATWFRDLPDPEDLPLPPDVWNQQALADAITYLNEWTPRMAAAFARRTAEEAPR